MLELRVQAPVPFLVRLKIRLDWKGGKSNDKKSDTTFRLMR